MAVFETFGKYKLTERLAFGGMAEVFLATVHGAAGFVKPVVIKRLHPRLSEDGDFVQMLIDEARITAQLTHGNICQVLDLGSVDGSYYIAMEFIPGEDVRTLQDTCNRHKVEMPVPAALHLVSEVLAGLDYAHRKEDADGTQLGIIHRDISPQNILISYEGEVKIIDFGIAKARLRLVQTQAGVIKGKFRYMAPEQAGADPLDHRADIFAAGIVLYELLRGSPHSLNLSDTDVLRKMRRAEFEPLQRFRPNLPSAIDNIVRRALQRRPRDRWGSAAEFRAELLAFLQEHKIAYGRTELAALMRQNFDEERRRRRSGSFSGAMQAGSGSDSIPASRNSPPPQLHRSDTEILGGDSDSATLPPGRRGAASHSQAAADSRRQWVAYAPTTTSSVTDERGRSKDIGTSEMQVNLRKAMLADEASPPLRLPDAEKTLTYSPPVDEDEGPTESRMPTGALDVTVPEAGRLRVAPSEEDAEGLKTTLLEQSSPTVTDDPLQGRTTEVQDEPPLPLHRQPTARRDQRSSEARSRSRPDTLASSAEVPLPISGSRAPESAPAKRSERAALRRSFFRTLAGLGLVVLFGAAVTAVLLILQGRTAELRQDADAEVALLPKVDSGVAREASAARGSWLVLRSKPSGAAIRYCGRTSGLVTPARLPVRTGRRCGLELELSGYEIYRLEVTPSPGSRLIVATLRRSRAEAVEPSGTGLLRVTSIQVGTVYVNERAVGRTPKVDLKLMPGTYSVRVHFPALEVRTKPRSVIVQAGRTTVAHFDPQP